jgi:two-component system, OmpR family, sensor histidine kinase SenX3
MDPGMLVAAALVFGVAVGAGVAWLIVYAARHGDRAARVVNSVVPDGVDQVLDALESAGIVLDPSNNVIKASPGALALGLVAGDMLAHRDLVDLVDRVRRDGETITTELTLPRGPFGDANVVLFIRVARLGTRYVLLLAEDRTEAHRLNAVRRDFVENISHELKTPIGAVSLLAEALQSAARDPDQVKRFAKRLTKESDRLARITREIIQLSRLQSADALTKPELIEIDHVVASAIDQNRVPADARGVTIVSGGHAGAQVYGDEALLATALHNLISNAIVYSAKGARVGIGVNHHDGVVEIAVTDQGIGIAQEEQDRIFERFYRIDPARSRHTGGTGLGLSIVKHVAENHGGDVRVWSQPGRGSTFTIRLPEATRASGEHLGVTA